MRKSVKDNFLFRHLDDEQLVRLVERMEEVKCDKGKVVCQEGDRGDYFYVVESGSYGVYQGGVQVTATRSIDGSTAPTAAAPRPAPLPLVDTARPRRPRPCAPHRCRLWRVQVHKYVLREDQNNPSFGELGLMYAKPRAATVKCLERGTLWALDRVGFREAQKTRQEARAAGESNPTSRQMERSWVLRALPLGGAAHLASDPGGRSREAGLLTPRPVGGARQADVVKILSKVELLKALSFAQLQQLRDKMRRENFAQGDKVITEGEPGNAFYVITAGTATVSREGQESTAAFHRRTVARSTDHPLGPAHPATLLRALNARPFGSPILPTPRHALDARLPTSTIDGRPLGPLAPHPPPLTPPPPPPPPPPPRPQEIGVLNMHSCFGESALITNSPRNASVSSREGELQTLMLDRDTFEQVLGPLSKIIEMATQKRDRAAKMQQNEQEAHGLTNVKVRRSRFVVGPRLLAGGAAPRPTLPVWNRHPSTSKPPIGLTAEPTPFGTSVAPRVASSTLARTPFRPSLAPPSSPRSRPLPALACASFWPSLARHFGRRSAPLFGQVESFKLTRLVRGVEPHLQPDGLGGGQLPHYYLVKYEAPSVASRISGTVRRCVVGARERAWWALERGRGEERAARGTDGVGEGPAASWGEGARRKRCRWGPRGRICGGLQRSAVGRRTLPV